MHYYLCPRCQFKVPSNKHVCHTCGFNMSTLAAAKTDSVAASKVVKGSFWSKFLGSNNKQEPGTEEPALS